ncbi:Lin1244/Lin1753 domain-containing protein [uncultured Ruminococcus sp.]|uniref:Lin1244/Lin1753 domain-containing protein n=1 Tax=uncultured Ruminococcus sp. TaxID=165186 RepID=UPI0025FF373D|nr:Lin1244/Lin1753 domain-containing protein [uncultured Ruminococcus sp.]
MGRPNKQTVEYFPHYVGGSRKTIFLLEDSFGNDGYAFWFKLLELLGSNEGHSYDISSPANRRYLYAYTKVEEETATQILDMLAECGNIDKELYTERQVIWCQNFVDNLKDVYSKRTTPLPKKPFSEDILPEKDRKQEEKPKPAPKKTKRKPPAKKTEPEKKEYGEFVHMTEVEHEKLVAKYGEAVTNRAIEMLDNYKGANNKKYASDYRAILNWAGEKARQEIERGGQNGPYQQNARNDNPGGEFRPSKGFKSE